MIRRNRQMKISRLSTFIKLAELKSFSLAAEALHLTQPAVSIQIKTLEEYYAVQLVSRGSEGVALTPEGELLYQEAKEILRIWDGIEQKINKLHNLVKGEMTIGVSSIPAMYIMPQIIVDFCQAYPLVELKMNVKDSQGVIQELIRKNYDLGIVGVKPQYQELTAYPITSDHLVLIVPKDHRLAQRKRVDKKDLVYERFILREEGSGTLNAMQLGFNHIGLSVTDLKIVAQLGSNEAVIAAVEAGLGISIVSNLAAQNVEKYMQIKIVEIENFQIHRDFYLTYHKDFTEKNLIRTFTEFIRHE